MLIDLHCHTKYSGDSRLEPDELIQAARSYGLDAICITEHDSFCASEPVEEIARAEGFPLFRGVEINTDKGHKIWEKHSLTPDGRIATARLLTGDGDPDIMKGLSREETAVVKSAVRESGRERGRGIER